MSYQDKPSLDELYHYGMPRRSGRYPWGSGDDPYQRTGDFLSRVQSLRDAGLSEKEIAEAVGLKSTTELRVEYRTAKNERRRLEVERAKSLREDGKSYNEIAEIMGFNNDSSVRSLLNEKSETRMNEAKKTAEILKQRIEETGKLIDVGAGVERELGITRTKLDEAIYMLEQEGYVQLGSRVDQATNPGKKTTLKLIGPADAKPGDAYDPDKIESMSDYHSHDGGETFDKFVYPKSMDSNRIQIRYAEEGGALKDGVVEIRRGVEDLSLGNSHYAQVRILVDDSKYIKGMALYSDDMPDGVDIVFNTNKKTGTPKGDVLKNIKDDPDNPFGSLIKAGGQSYYIDKNGNRQLSLINKRAEEGDWGEWADHLSSQFLSKQNLPLIKKQLDLAAADKMAEFDEICSLTNPTVKKRLLQSFADDCDAAAVHLKAAALPRQKYQVILPITSLKDTEVYAPNYKDGEQVALIRYPHAGTFEIPVLTVNNKHRDSRRIIGTDALDAVGINSKVAERLSGADFDGDTVMVIPTGRKTKITSTPPLQDLVGFDNKAQYGADEVRTDSSGAKHYYRNGKEYKIMTSDNTQKQMGVVSNLITDMTLKGADSKEIARAVKHSMVVIDAEKHKLDYKQSELDNNIAGLKKKYQSADDPSGEGRSGGAATIISRAKSRVDVTKKQGSPTIDKETGALTWKEADDLYYTKTSVDKKTGKVTTVTKKRTQPSKWMAEATDAYELVSDMDNPKERAYADYANKLKALANQARKEMVNTGKIEYSSSANATYKKEVDSLNSQLNVALKNAPRERKAQLIASSVVKAKTEANPDMTKKEIKKESQRALTAARQKVGAQRTTVKISDREWEAIQAGAISENILSQILNNTDIDNIRERATPRTRTTLSAAKQNRIKCLRASGYTTEQIAAQLNVSASTITKYLKGKE